MLKEMHAEVHVTLLCNKVQKIQFSYMQIFLPHTNTCIWWPTCISINNVWQLLITCGTEAFCRGQWVDYRPQQTACAQTWPRCDQTFCRIRHAQASVSGRKWHAGCLKKKIENKTILSHLSQTPSITQDIVAAFTYCIYPCWADWFHHRTEPATCSSVWETAPLH